MNAKQHKREAPIIAQAGKPGQVTIATNMAGRGTDIVLGGSWQAEIDELGEDATEAKIKKIKTAWQKRHQEVLDAGGLKIIGSERHESRRIDNQLRGRAGRQGDPGESRFFLSLDDSLVKIFASERMIALMRRLSIGEGEAIESKMVSKAIAKAQKKVEQHYFDMRKQLLDYDDVSSSQRSVIYDQRNKLLQSDAVGSVIDDYQEEIVTELMNRYIPENSLFEQWDIKGFSEALLRDFDSDFDFDSLFKENPNITDREIYEKMLSQFRELHNQKRDLAEEKSFKNYERVVILHSMDSAWRDHLSQMDYLRGSIGLRGYAQKDPKQEYKREAFELFSKMLIHFKYDVISTLSKLKKEQIMPEQVEDQWRGAVSDMNFEHKSDLSLEEGSEAPDPESVIDLDSSDKEPGTFVRTGEKVGRNDSCPCGSGKKYKFCHGKIS